MSINLIPKNLFLTSFFLRLRFNLNFKGSIFFNTTINKIEQNNITVNKSFDTESLSIINQKLYFK